VNPTTFTHQPEARRTMKLNQVLTTRTQRTHLERTIWRLDASLTPYFPFWTYPLDDRTLLATHSLTPFHHLFSSLSRLRQTTAAVLAPPFAPTSVRETFGLPDSRLPQYITIPPCLSMLKWTTGVVLVGGGMLGTPMFGQTAITRGQANTKWKSSMRFWDTVRAVSRIH